MIAAGAVIAKYWGIYLSTVFATAGVDIPSTLHLGAISLEWGPFFIVAVFTGLLILGTQESARVNNVFTLIKIAITLFVIVVGFTYMDLKNFTPFVPPAQPPVAAMA
jgi:APA family basic amino acid/polyamine antiporter